MDKLINKHIDSLEELEGEINRIIDSIIDDIDINALVKNPNAELDRVKEETKELFLNEYAPQAIELGFDLAQEIQKRIKNDKDIVVENTDNPKLNADDKSKDKKQD